MSMIFFLLHQNYCWSQSAPLFSVGNDCEVDKWVCQFGLFNYVKYVTVRSPLWKAGRLIGWIEALIENAPQTFRSFPLEERITTLQEA
jgi:hypothetical protein